MALSPEFLQSLLATPDGVAWDAIRQQVSSVWQPSYQKGHEVSQARQREDELSPLDLFLSHSVWPLWQSFSTTVPRGATALANFWVEPRQGTAVLILDSLSLRELPLLVAAAEAHNYTIHRTDVLGSELPAETNTFAKALGFSSRSSLDNNGGHSASFPKAHTLTSGLPWEDAAAQVPPAPNVFYWHHWPDERLHHLDGPDGGFERLFPEAIKQLRSEAFWQFVGKLATGRRLVITSDHGYAVTGGFHNVGVEEKDYLKEKFAAQRFRSGIVDTRAWLPPLTATLDTSAGPITFVTGRRKWQVPGGFPLLSHGGLTLMDVFVPWLEISTNPIP